MQNVNKKTKTINVQSVLTQNNKSMIKGKCNKSKLTTVADSKKGEVIFTVPAVLAILKAAGFLEGEEQGLQQQ